MAKRHITSNESFELRQALQIAVLDALMQARRWAPGDLIFHGGTSLHLAHGSPRYSEDLDFLVNASLKLEPLATAVQTRLADTAWLPTGTVLKVSKAEEGANPHAFLITVSGAEIIGSVRVKVELWQTNKQVMSALKVEVATMKSVSGPTSGIQTFVPTADLAEIYADKVFALVARPYLKARDVFDLHWLVARNTSLACSADDLRLRLATYPNQTAAAWLTQAEVRRQALLGATPAVAQNLKRWLPSSWPLNDASVQTMVDASIKALDHGVEIMRAIQADVKADRGRRKTS